MKLRPYQQDVKNGIKQAWADGAENVCAVLPTGGGKTVLFTDIMREEPTPSIAIVHRQELVSQISIALGRHGIHHSIIAPKATVKIIVNRHMQELGRSFYNPGALHAVAGVDTLVRRTEAMSQYTLWVQDECFPAGTLVSGTPIELIKPGDTVSAFNEKTGEVEPRKVVRLFKNKAPESMVRIETSGHHVIICTLGHPIWTRRGWIDAGDLTENDEVLTDARPTDVHGVREGIPGNIPAEIQPQESGPVLLQQNVLGDLQSQNIKRDYGPDEQGACFRADETKQPYEKPGDERESVEIVKKDRTRTTGERGERARASESGKNPASDFIRHRVYRPMCDMHKNAERLRVPAVLQSRRGEHRAENCSRGGRPEPRSACSAGAGPEKRRPLEWHGVASVTIQKRGDIEKSSKCSFDGYVYNIEVEGLHTYTANGVVVHNCHHVLKGNKWGKVTELFPNARGLGVTATPERADGKGLGRHAHGLFDTLIVGPNMRDLIHMTPQALTEYKIYCPPSDLNLDEVNITASGDYSRVKLKQAVEKSRVIGDVVDHYKRLAPGKLGVTFATDVETATHIAQQFNEAGVPAEVVSAKTKDTTRAAILQKFKNREILQLINVDLFGEGFDLPAIEVVSMARPTASYGLFVQQFGRALRLLDGKAYALIIDHVSNVIRHGLPDMGKSWTLNARDKRSGGNAPGLTPVTSCVKCTGVYERLHKKCPFCGHYEPPAMRDSIEFVDGDLMELDAVMLAKLRGEVARIDKDPERYREELAAKNTPVTWQMSNVKKHVNRQEAQRILRATISWWAGFLASRGYDENKTMRKFYFTFKIDLLTAQTLNERDATELTAKVIEDMQRV